MPSRASRTAARLLAVVLACATTVGAGATGALATAAPVRAGTPTGGVELPDLTVGQWHLPAIGAPAAWTVSTGAGVTVAVLDSGIDSSHPDLAGAVQADGIVAYRKELPTIRSADLFDMIGHGTHVAGLVAGRADGRGITGVAPDASIIAAKILPDTSTGIAIDWAEQMPRLLARLKAAGASVVNMSFGSGISQTADPADDPLCRGIAAAQALDLVLVAAAGNDGFDENKPAVPAMCPGVLSVGALDADSQPAFFTTFNDQVDIAAPGYNVLSSLPAAQSSYGLESGTSMASPIVAGVAALLRSAHPDWSATRVVTQLLATARDVYTPGHDVLTGAGAVDAAAALGLPATTARVPAFALQAAQEGVRWRQPSQRVDRYTLTLTSHTTGATTWQQNLPGDDVFAAVPTKLQVPGDWVTLEAHLNDGTTARTIAIPFGPAAGTAPPEVSRLKIAADPRNANLIRATWRNDPRLLGFVVALIVDGEVVHISQFSTENGPLPQHLLMPRRLEPYHDYRVAVVGYGNTPSTSLVDTRIRARIPIRWQASWFGRIAVLRGHVAEHLTAASGGTLTATIRHTNGTTLRRTVTVVPSPYGGGTVRLAVRAGDTVTIAGTRQAYRVRR